MLTPDILFDSYRGHHPRLSAKSGRDAAADGSGLYTGAQGGPPPDDALRQWIDGLKGAGITVMIVSNNRSGVRVTEFCGDLGIGYQGHAGKPSPKGLRAAMERTGTDSAHTAMLGDKLLTDMLQPTGRASGHGMVEPLGGPVGLWNRVLHLLQRPFKRACPYKYQKNPGENTK